jgi:hypothetical protein
MTGIAVIESADAATTPMPPKIAKSLIKDELLDDSCFGSGEPIVGNGGGSATDMVFLPWIAAQVADRPPMPYTTANDTAHLLLVSGTQARRDSRARRADNGRGSAKSGHFMESTKRSEIAP